MHPSSSVVQVQVQFVADAGQFETLTRHTVLLSPVAGAYRSYDGCLPALPVVLNWPFIPWSDASGDAHVRVMQCT